MVKVRSCGKALVSRSSIKRFATIGLIGEPVAVPSTCSYNLPWNVNYVLLRQSSSMLVICLDNMVVLRCRSLSSSSFLCMMAITGSVGTDVNNASTS